MKTFEDITVINFKNYYGTNKKNYEQNDNKTLEKLI